MRAINIENYNSALPEAINNKYMLEIFIAMEQTLVELSRSDSANISSGLNEVDKERLNKNLTAINEKIALVKNQLAVPVDLPEFKTIYHIDKIEEIPGTDNFDVFAIADSLALFAINFVSSGQSNKATAYIHPEDFKRLENGIKEIQDRVTSYIATATPLDLPATTSTADTIYPKKGIDPTLPK